MITEAKSELWDGICMNSGPGKHVGIDPQLEPRPHCETPDGLQTAFAARNKRPKREKETKSDLLHDRTFGGSARDAGGGMEPAALVAVFCISAALGSAPLECCSDSTSWCGLLLTISRFWRMKTLRSSFPAGGEIVSQLGLRASAMQARRPGAR